MITLKTTSNLHIEKYSHYRAQLIVHKCTLIRCTYALLPIHQNTLKFETAEVIPWHLNNLMANQGQQFTLVVLALEEAEAGASPWIPDLPELQSKTGWWWRKSEWVRKEKGRREGRKSRGGVGNHVTICLLIVNLKCWISLLQIWKVYLSYKAASFDQV